MRWNIAQVMRDRADRKVLETLSALDLAEGLAEPRWHYGLDLLRNAGLTAGTLYVTLDRLESRDEIQSRWESLENAEYPRRRMYRLHPEADVIDIWRASRG